MNPMALLADRAIALADRWAVEVITTEGVPLEQADHYGMANEYGAEVVKLARTSEHFQEATQWLIDRQLGKLTTDAHGDVMILNLPEV